MPFDFTCPYCHLKTLVEDRFAGTTGPCAECGKTITLPGKSSDSAIAPVVPHSTVGKSSARNALHAIATILVAGTAVGLVAMFIGPALQRARQTRNRNLCMSNMQQIVTALNEYAKIHGSYPPPFVTDAKGKKLYSWRVLILPQLGYDGIYKDFILDQPWDSPTNANLIRLMPEIFASPGSPDAKDVGESNYVLLTGIGTLFPTSGPLSPKDISDAHSQTILLAETTNNKLKWTEPGDIDASLGITLGNRPRVDVGGNHPDGANVVAVDGTPLFLPPDVSPSMLEALKTPSGGERIDTSTLTP